ncbi:MAG TPA: hypothetical protein VD931_09280 [Baekduia sp.]|nr:hypothetical protein [Baekduia sp.]
MAKKTKAAKAAAAGVAVKGAKKTKDLSTTVDQEQLRDNVRVAFEAARDAYERVNGKGAAALFEDPKLHEDVRQAASAVRGATSAIQPKKKKRGPGRLLMLGLVGAIAAVALSEGLRNKVLDALFGAEEEFDYTSTTTTNAASPAGAPSAAPSPAA